MYQPTQPTSCPLFYELHTRVSMEVTIVSKLVYKLFTGLTPCYKGDITPTYIHLPRYDGHPKKTTARLPALPDVRQSTRASNGAGWERSPQKRQPVERRNFPWPENRFMPIEWKRTPASFLGRWPFGGLSPFFFKEPLKISRWNPQMKVWKMISLFKQVMFRFQRQFSRVFPKTSSHTNKKRDVTPQKKQRNSGGDPDHDQYISNISRCVCL